MTACGAHGQTPARPSPAWKVNSHSALGFERFAPSSCEPLLAHPKFRMTNSPCCHPPAGVSSHGTLLSPAVPKIATVQVQPTADQGLVLRILHHSHQRGLSAHPLATGKRSLSSRFHLGLISPSPPPSCENNSGFMQEGWGRTRPSRAHTLPMQ